MKTIRSYLLLSLLALTKHQAMAGEAFGSVNIDAYSVGLTKCEIECALNADYGVDNLDNFDPSQCDDCRRQLRGEQNERKLCSYQYYSCMQGAGDGGWWCNCWGSRELEGSQQQDEQLAQEVITEEGNHRKLKNLCKDLEKDEKNFKKAVKSAMKKRGKKTDGQIEAALELIHFHCLIKFE